MRYEENTSAVEELIYFGKIRHEEYNGEPPKVLILSEHAYQMLLRSPSLRHNYINGFMGDIAVYDGMTIIRIMERPYEGKLTVQFGQGSMNHLLQSKRSASEDHR